jgi:hypothetical protein
MIGRIASAIIGKKIADRYGTGGRGMIIGALAPMIARRAFGPLGLALAGGYVAKKVYDGRKRRTRAEA